ncbi:MAG TPA: hypothetical protein VGF54_20595 [Streptosporangiaceae bacterium]|jgi:hypothetical protein
MTGQGLPDDESKRLELREAITAFHSQLAMLVQALGIVITADVVLLAYGFTQRRSAIFLLASLLPIAMLVMFLETMTFLVPITYVALKLERSLSLHEAPFIGTYVQSRQGLFPTLFHGGENPDELKTQHFVPKIPFRALLKDRRSALLVASFVAQFCLFVISITVYHYRFL